MGKLMHLRQAYAAGWNKPKQLAEVVRGTWAGFLAMLRAVLRLAVVPPRPRPTLWCGRGGPDRIRRGWIGRAGRVSRCGDAHGGVREPFGKEPFVNAQTRRTAVALALALALLGAAATTPFRPWTSG